MNHPTAEAPPRIADLTLFCAGLPASRTLAPMHHAADIIGAWPADHPLAAISGRRWVYLAKPAAVFRVESTAGTTRSTWLKDGAEARPPVVFTHDPLRDLASLLAWGRTPAETRGWPAPFKGGWIGSFSYDLGRVIEPAVERRPGRAAADRAWPLIELAWCPSVVAIDRIDGGAFSLGSASALLPTTARQGRTFSLGDARSRTGQEAFEVAVARAIEYIRAGDVFQVNLAHRLSASFQGSTRALFASLCDAANPWHGAYLELPASREGATTTGRALASCSPELFLSVRPTPEGPRIVTRPMKGTRSATADPRELEAAPKDRAELNMIIDLMRNDLGRVCRAGSVRVERPREIERHGGERGVWQATATVAGLLRDGLGLPDLLCAAFPPGSVTGAPKIRAMQIIDELEPVRRGPYCGNIGWIGADGAVELNVAIRTALISGTPGDAPSAVRDGVMDYSVGAGIVADSEPGSEWRETMDKAGILRALAPQGEPSPPRSWQPAAMR
jgi:para-aminobenzoate synthetase component 1